MFVVRRLALLLGLVAASAGVAQSLPPSHADYVVITRDALVGEFSRLAAHREAEGMDAEVVAIDWIEAHVPAGVDQAETIRNFVIAAHAEWGTRFLLLGGDVDVVPARIVWSNFYPVGGGTEIACDLYFAGLDGDWNADGDDIWGEPRVSAADPGDDADLVPEVWVGRAPVSTAVEAARFVDGTITADASARLWRSVLLWAQVLFPSDWQPGEPIVLDGAELADAVYQMLMALPDPPVVTRMYQSNQWPYDLPLTRENALAELNSGHHGIVHHISQGWADGIDAGDALVTLDDVAQLANAPDYFLITGIHSNACRFQLETIYEGLLTAPNGGAVAGVGLANVAFPANCSAYVFHLMETLFVDGPRRLGPAVETARATGAGSTDLNTVDRWTTLGLTLLGDPALRVGPVPDWSEITGAAVPPPVLRLAAAAPNPFNPTTTLRFVLPAAGRVTLSLYDLAGHHVATLVDGERPVGEHAVTWHGLDDAGQQAPAGVYVARLRWGDRTASQRLTMVR